MNVYFTEKQISDIQVILGLQEMEWGSLAEDAEIAGAYDQAEGYENLMLQSNEISRKLYDGDTEFTKKEIDLLISVYEETITDNKTREDLTEEQRNAFIEEEEGILKLLQASNN